MEPNRPPLAEYLFLRLERGRASGKRQQRSDYQLVPSVSVRPRLLQYVLVVKHQYRGVGASGHVEDSSHRQRRQTGTLHFSIESISRGGLAPHLACVHYSVIHWARSAICFTMALEMHVSLYTYAMYYVPIYVCMTLPLCTHATYLCIQKKEREKEKEKEEKKALPLPLPLG